MARDTPELDKLAAISERSQAIGEFLDTSPYILYETVPCEKYHPRLAATAYCSQGSHTVPTSKTIQQILAEYFGIDLQEVERERRMILRGMQETANNL